MKLAELLEIRLQERVSAQLKNRLKTSDLSTFAAAFSVEIERQREALCEVLLDLIEPPPAPEVKAAAPEEAPPAGKRPPTSDILARAEKLQRLAMDSPSPEERDNAWRAFEILWNKYQLPANLGMELRR